MSSRSTLPSAILALLAEGPMHPYRIQQQIRLRRKHEVINVSQRAGLYQAIRRLEREGLIRAHAVERDENRPERTVYELTDAGRSAAGAWLRAGMATPRREFPEFPAVLSFLDHLTPAEVVLELRKRFDALGAEEARLREGFAAAIEHGVPRFFLVENEYLQTINRAELAWVAGLIGELEAGTLTWSPAEIRATRSGLPDQPP